MPTQRFIISRTIKILRSQSIGYCFFRKNPSYEFLGAKAYPFKDISFVVSKIVKNFCLYPTGQGVYNYIPTIASKIADNILVDEYGLKQYKEEELPTNNPSSNKQWFVDIVEGYLVSQTVTFAIASAKLSNSRYGKWLYDESLYMFWKAAVDWFGGTYVLGCAMFPVPRAMVPENYQVISPEQNVLDKLSGSQADVIRDWYIVDGSVAALSPGFVRTGYIWYAFFESLYNVSFKEFYYLFAARQFRCTLDDVCTALDNTFEIPHDGDSAKLVYLLNISQDFLLDKKEELMNLKSLYFPNPPPVVGDNYVYSNTKFY